MQTHGYRIFCDVPVVTSGQVSPAGDRMFWYLPLVLFACAPSPMSVVPESSNALAPTVPPAPAEPAPREPTETRYAATELLVSWDGAMDAPKGLVRTRDEAKVLAGQYQTRVRAGEDLSALAKEYSDDPLRARNGHLGVYRTGTMDLAFERAVAGAEIGGIGPVADTAFGFYVVRREMTQEIHIGQIQVSFAGNWRSKVTRTREEAQIRILSAVEKLDAGESLASVSTTFSEKGLSDSDLGTLTAGQFIPAIEAVALGLPIHGHSPIIESPYGLHVVVRLD